MAAKQETNMFEFYSRGFKAWSDIFGKRGNFPFPITDMNKTVSRNIMSSMEIYNAWLKGVDGLIEEGFNAGHKIMRGEDVEPDNLTKAMRAAYDSITDTVLKSVENTPFEGIRHIDEAVRNSLDSFADEQKMMKAFVKEVLCFGSKTAELLKSSNGYAADMFSDFLKGKPGVSGDGYKRTIDACEKTLSHCAEILRPLGALQPGCKQTVEETITWTKKNTGICMSWLETNLKQYEQLRRVPMEFYKLVEDALKEGDSLEDFYEKWLEAMEKAKLIFTQDTQSYKIISEFISKNTEFIKSTIDLYKSTNGFPYHANGYADKSVVRSEQPRAEAA